jgi:hypothetical protein
MTNNVKCMRKQFASSIKRPVLALIFFSAFLSSHAFGQPSSKQPSSTQPSSTQPSSIDSLKNLLTSPRNDTNTAKNFLALAHLYIITKDQDSALPYANSGYDLAKRLNFKPGIARGLGILNHIYIYRGNYPKALELLLLQLKGYELENDKPGMAKVLGTLASLYDDEEDEQQAMLYAKRLYNLDKERGGQLDICEDASTIGFYYCRMNSTDSALRYFQEAYLLANRFKDSLPGVMALNTEGLGEANMALGNTTIALSYYYMSAKYAEASNNTMYKAFIYQDMGAYFKKQGQPDSSIYYYEMALKDARAIGYVKMVLDLDKDLAFGYEGRDDHKALNYFKLHETIRDSMYSATKTKEVQSLTFNEQERQKEILARQQEDEQQRKEAIQYAAIAIGLITFGILFLLLSRSVIVHVKIIKYLSIVGLLIIFEFINLLIHPYLENFTHRSPVFMLVILVSIAALLVPLHHQLEKSLTKRMIEKNNRIKLSFAKRMIADLEPESQQGAK